MAWDPVCALSGDTDLRAVLFAGIRAHTGQCNRSLTESWSNSLFWRNVIGNIAAFFPMGLLVALLAPKRPYCVFALAIVYLSCAVAEILQYVFNVGSFDIDDVILNTLGGFLGILVSIPVRKLLTKQQPKKKQSNRKKS